MPRVRRSLRRHPAGREVRSAVMISSPAANNVSKLFLIALGGVAGALARYAVSGLGFRIFGEAFPWGTLLVNAIGCLLAGALWAVSERTVLPPGFGPLVFTGFLGAFTTFSTYGLESFNLLRDGQAGRALAYVAGSTLLGLALVALGYAGVRYLIGLFGTGTA